MFYVVEGKTKTEPLLSYKTAQELGMVTVANTVETEPSTVEDLLGKFSDTFEGIGKMKGVKVDLNIDTDVKPVAQRLRRIPLSVRLKIEEEVRRLQEEDIIEKIDKPSSWISPTVITPKKNPKEIGLNLDMRVANGAIPRVNSITPTIDELIQELIGAHVFSHLDMNYGYHQLELDENSRDITTFSTHIGFYQYKRLNYGNKSAGDILQNRIKEEPTSFPGLQCEDEARHGKALVWAGHVSTQKMAVFDSYSSRSGEIFFNEIYKSSKQINSQKTSQSISIYV
jgi:hypothetical protein